MIWLEDLIAIIKDKEIKGALNLAIEGISYDSRKVKPGFAFVCVRGYKTDGHQFVDSALANGAVAIIAEEKVDVPAGVTLVIVHNTRQALALLSAAFFGFPAREMTMIGVTGTNGKTTTTHLIAAILENQNKQVGLIGTIKNKIGNRELPVTNTTPESLELQGLLKDMVSSGMSYAVMEVSSHALYLDRILGTEFDIAVFTNITQDHLDFHKTMDEYLSAKSKLFTELGREAVKKHPKYAIINVDDPNSHLLIKQTEAKVITYGVKNKADIMAQNINIGPGGVSFAVVSDWGNLELNLKMTGMFTVYNSLAAIATAFVEGIKEANIKEALEKVKGVAGRFELVDEGQDYSVVVDYAHTPDSLENVLRTSSEFVQGRLITVFGCGGDRDKTKRPIMGEVSARYSDYSILTSDNPRTEDPLEILKQVEEGLASKVNKDKYTVIADRREAIKHAIGMAQKGDIIMIAGKGHETYQIIGDKVFPFDDREEASIALRNIRSKK